MSGNGRKRPLKTPEFEQSVRPVSEKADSQSLAVPESLWIDRFTLAVSMGRYNTVTKTQKTVCMLMKLKETSKSLSDRESGARRPLEASRGAELKWASV